MVYPDFNLFYCSISIVYLHITELKFISMDLHINFAGSLKNEFRR